MEKHLDISSFHISFDRPLRTELGLCDTSHGDAFLHELRARHWYQICKYTTASSSISKVYPVYTRCRLGIHRGAIVFHFLPRHKKGYSEKACNKITHVKWKGSRISCLVSTISNFQTNFTDYSLLHTYCGVLEAIKNKIIQTRIWDGLK